MELVMLDKTAALTAESLPNLLPYGTMKELHTVTLYRSIAKY